MVRRTDSHYHSSRLSWPSIVLYSRTCSPNGTKRSEIDNEPENCKFLIYTNKTENRNASLGEVKAVLYIEVFLFQLVASNRQCKNMHIH